MEFLPRNKRYQNVILDAASTRSVSRRGCLPPALGQTRGGVWGKRGVTAVSSRSVEQAKWGCCYEEGRNYSDDMMGDPGVLQSHHHHPHSALHDIHKLCVGSGVCNCVCQHSFKEFSLRTCLMLPLWKTVLNPYKKRAMPNSFYPEACQSGPKGKGPHNLLFVPLLLRKYFLKSSLLCIFWLSLFSSLIQPCPLLFICFLNTGLVHYVRAAMKRL